jgi:predicted phage terminase large subunit-like protein
MKDEKTALTRGSTYENLANLAPQYQAHIIARYENTRLGRQELHAELLEDMPGALWQRVLLEATRVATMPPLARIVVAIDPAATANEDSNETGVIVAGKAADGQVFILDDLSLRASPNEWGRAVVAAYHRHKADRVVYETNQGGDMVAAVLRTVDPNVPLTPVTASRSKQTRAEPVAALYEQGKVHHVGMFGTLEDQLCSWVPGETSPDRLDALVWAVTELALQGAGVGIWL